MSVDMVFTRQLSPNLTKKTCLQILLKKHVLICCITLKTVKSVIIYGIAVQIMIFQSGKHKYNTIPPWNSPYYAWFPLTSHIVGCSSLININITLYHLGTVPTMLGSH